MKDNLSTNPSDINIILKPRPKFAIPLENELKRIRKWALPIADCIDKSDEVYGQTKNKRKKQFYRLVAKLNCLVWEYQEMSFQELIETLTAIDSLIKAVYLKSFDLRRTLLYGDVDIRELSPGEVLDKIFEILPSKI